VRIIALFLLLLASSCNRPTLSVDTGYFTRKDLASYHVGTPDPNKQSPIFGQRLYVSWNVTNEEFTKAPLTLHLQVHLKKGGLLDKVVALDTPEGSYIFPIVGDDYTGKGGLLSYKVDLLSGDTALATSRHKFWVEEIKFSE